MGQKDEGKRGAYKRGLQALCYRDRPRDFCGNILSGKSRQVEGNTNSEFFLREKNISEHQVTKLRTKCS